MKSEAYIRELESKNAELERMLKVEHEKYKIIADNTNIGLWEYDIKCKKLDQFKKLDGKWSDSNLIIENYRESIKSWGLIYPDDMPVFDAYCDSMDNGDPHFEYDLRAITDDYSFRWLRYTGSTVYDKNGKPIKVVGKTLDVTKEKTDRADLVRKANQDPLTHLSNKAYTKELSENFLMKNGGSAGILLFIIDIDFFKNINDRWGHLYGDYVLESFSTLLKGNFSAGDVVGRIGGDEFLVLCPEVNNAEESAPKIAQRLLDKAANMVLKDGKRISISIGAAVYPKHGHTYEALYRCADIALYQAKRSGKNRYAIYSRAATYDTNIGETSRKQSDEQIKSSEPNVKYLINIDKELLDFSFDTISRAENFDDAVLSIFTEIGKYFDLDRISVLINDFEHHKLLCPYYWNSKSADQSAHEALIKFCGEYWDRIECRYYSGEQYYKFYISDERQDDIHSSDEFKAAGIKSMLQFPVFDGEQIIGVVTFEVHKEERKWKDGVTATLSSITKMITSYMLRLHSRDELENELLYTEAALDAQQLSYYVVDPNTYVLNYVSKYANLLFPQIHTGAKCYNAVMGRSTPCSNCPLNGINKNKPTYTLETYSEKYDKWLSMTAASINKKGSEEYLVACNDVTAFIERVTSRDQLTGVLTYETFKAKALKLMLEHHHKYSIVLVGIKDFAGINDVFGYEVGDEVLKCAARQFRSILTEYELLGRIKGDDFILLMDSEGKFSPNDRLNHACISLEIILREKYPKMNISCIGGSYKDEDSDYSISKEIDKANRAKHKAAEHFSKSNHNFVEYDKDIDSQVKEERAIERVMVSSLVKRQFQVYLQPKVNMLDETIGGAEALVRWIAPDGSFVPNGKFIPLFEKNGFIIELDKFVYNEIFSRMHEWLEQGKKVPIISMNVSRLHLFDEEFPEYLNGLVEKYQIPHDLVEIEITESVFFDNIERLIAIISKLQKMGFVISMDDFGTGYSTLSLMKSMPVDIIKIDGSFFLKSTLDEKNKAIISSIIHLSKSLNFKVVAEGIETREQALYIKSENVDYAQGFLYYRPMPMDDFAKLI